MSLNCSYVDLDEEEGTAQLCSQKASYIFNGNSICRKCHIKNFVNIMNNATNGTLSFEWLPTKHEEGNTLIQDEDIVQNQEQDNESN